MTTDLGDELREIASRYLEDLAPVPWASETDRWAELVFCVLNAFVADDPARCRRLVDTLGELGLTEPATLAEAGNPSGTHHVVVSYALARYGFTESDAQRAIRLLAQLAGVVGERYGGKIQRYLRQQAERIRDDLVASLAVGSDSETELHVGITLWLQNAVNMPLSVADKNVDEFCDRHGVGLEELEKVADEIDFNVALVDDIIRLDQAARKEEGTQR
jgi:hypothetical protein